MLKEHRWFCFFISVLSLTLFIPQPAFCHRVNIFCYVEGKQVKCEAKFTPGGPVKSGQIVVYSKQTGKRLLTTSTDKNGKAVFNIPKEAIKNHWDLKVVCNAEMGHRNFWVVRADELPTSEVAKAPAHGGQAGDAPAISTEELEKALSRVLSCQLAPIERDLAQLKENRITVEDIFAGLGYIFGLAGVAFYFLGKRQRHS